MLTNANKYSADYKADVRKHTLKSQIADKLGAMISSHMIKEGEALPSERELAKSYDVSRETVRGALQILTEHGFIEVSQGSRSVVVKGAAKRIETSSVLNDIQSYDAITVAETRKVVESAILRSAAINISDSDLEKLESMLAYQGSVLDDPVAFQISDNEFHTIIYQSCRNALLTKMALDVYSYALEYRTAALLEEASTVRSLREHHQLFRSLKDHDPDAAERAIVSHVDSIFKSTLIMQNKDSE